jgi:hypothetical protein
VTSSKETPEDVFKVVAGIAVFVVIAVLLLHSWLDSETRVLPVHMRANGWIVGEYRTCFSLGKGPDDSDQQFSHDIADMLFLDCDGNETSESHDLDVKFTKPLFSDEGEKKQRTWNCQRKQSDEGVASLECNLVKKATDK